MRERPFRSTTNGVRADKRIKEGQEKKGVMVEGNNEQNKVEFGQQPLPIMQAGMSLPLP